jgi:hypothetical protein
MKQEVAFLKKSSAKDFCSQGSNARASRSKSFLLLFFKKEALDFFGATR